MPRPPRIDVADTVYHVINRANARTQIFNHESDYRAFFYILTEAQERFDMRILACCIMPNHWHLVLYPKQDGDLQKFMAWLTMTHTQRWHVAHNTVGTGHLYQGRYKSFPVETDNYLFAVLRYVERNALRANLVARAELWKWGSARWRTQGSNEQKKFLSAWPIAEPDDYLSWLNEPQSDAELDVLRLSVNRGRPFGSESWCERSIKEFNLLSTVRSRGGQRK